MLRQRSASKGATWLTAWALATAIVATILLMTAADGSSPDPTDPRASAAGAPR